MSRGTKGTKPVTEQEFREKYFERAKACTPETFADFIKDINSEDLDYGTTCIAAGLIAGAAIWAFEHSSRGGMTGFMAGAAAWEFLRTWGALYPSEALGGRMVDFGNLLYPQYAGTFTTIPKSVAEKLPEEATKLLQEKDLHPEVRTHLEMLAAGGIPFGLEVSE